jgi:hypothetical protein
VAGFNIADLVAPHQLDCLRPQDSRAVQGTAVEQHPDKRQVVRRTRIDAAATGK